MRGASIHDFLTLPNLLFSVLKVIHLEVQPIMDIEQLHAVQNSLLFTKKFASHGPAAQEHLERHDFLDYLEVFCRF